MELSRRALLSAAGLAIPGIARADDGVTIPFGMMRNMAWVAVQLDGKDPPLPFMIDTGASIFCVLDTKAVDLKLAKLGKTDGRAAIGRARFSVYEADLLLGGALKQDDAFIVGLSRLPKPMQGLIPPPKAQIMSLNFDRREMLLIRQAPKDIEGYHLLDLEAGEVAGGSANIMGAYASEPDARDIRDHRPIITAEFDGQPVKLMVDTGSSAGLYLFPDYVKREGLWDSAKTFVPIGVRTTVGSSAARAVRARKLKIGKIAFANPVVILGNPADSDKDGDSPVAGLIGMEFIRRLNFVLQPAQRKLWIKPNAAIADGYRYDRAGAEVDAVGDTARVVRLDPGLPADRAGLRDGDKIIGWRGRDGIDGLSWALKGAPGSKVDIQIEREGKPEMITVVLEEPL